MAESVSPATAPHLGICAIDAGRVYVDHHLARSGGGVWRLTVAQHFWPAMARQ